MIDALMREGLSHSQTGTSLPLSSPVPLCLYLHHFSSHSFSVWLASFSSVCPWLLSVSHSLSALVPLSRFPCCHQSPTPCLSVILCLIAIDRYRNHLRTNLIKSDKRRYFYWFIRNTPTYENTSTTTTYTRIGTDTHTRSTTFQTFKFVFLLIDSWLVGENH